MADDFKKASNHAGVCKMSETGKSLILVFDNQENAYIPISTLEKVMTSKQTQAIIRFFEEQEED